MNLLISSQCSGGGDGVQGRVPFGARCEMRNVVHPHSITCRVISWSVRMRIGSTVLSSLWPMVILVVWREWENSLRISLVKMPSSVRTPSSTRSRLCVSTRWASILSFPNHRLSSHSAIMIIFSEIRLRSHQPRLRTRTGVHVQVLLQHGQVRDPSPLPSLIPSLIIPLFRCNQHTTFSKFLKDSRYWFLFSLHLFVLQKSLSPPSLWSFHWPLQQSRCSFYPRSYQSTPFKGRPFSLINRSHSHPLFSSKLFTP